MKNSGCKQQLFRGLSSSRPSIRCWLDRLVSSFFSISSAHSVCWRQPFWLSAGLVRLMAFTVPCSWFSCCAPRRPNSRCFLFPAMRWRFSRLL
jgi:hypothetical protein